MTWSTRELADLAGTTVNTVRHYHALGLLEAPVRRLNGYKQYEVRHLVHLIRVRRLAELGVPLSQVGEVAGVTDAAPGGLRQVDADLRAEIDRLRQARADIAAILRDRAPADSPRGFESVASRLSEPDRAFLHIVTRLCDRDAIAGVRERIAAEPPGVAEEFAALPPDVDEATRQRIADQIARAGAHWRSADHPWLGRRRSSATAHQILEEALEDLYNASQRDVLRRATVASALLREATSSTPTHRTETVQRRVVRHAEQAPAMAQ